MDDDGAVTAVTASMVGSIVVVGTPVVESTWAEMGTLVEIGVSVEVNVTVGVGEVLGCDQETATRPLARSLILSVELGSAETRISGRVPFSFRVMLIGWSESAIR